MNPVLRLVSGHGANSSPSSSESSESSSAVEPTHEFIPGFEPRPAGLPASVSVSGPPAGSDASHASLLQTGHLVRCRRCGELNGRSADACWNCEADLQAGTLPTGIPAAANSEHAPSSLFPEPPLLTSPVSSNELRPARGATMPAPLPAPSLRRAPSTGLVATIALLTMLLAGGGLYYYFVDGPESEAARAAAAIAAGRARAAATPVQPAAAMVAAPAAAATPGNNELPSVDAALRAADLVSQQAKPDSMGAYVAPTERVIAASTKTRSVAGSTAPPGASAKARAQARAAAQAATVAPPAVRSRPPAAVAGPCTPNVAALGLCSAPASNPTKE